MSKNAVNFNQVASLRRRAVAHLTAGSRPDDHRASPSEAMAVLMGLSSSPTTAGDALAVLHELQVHQVELDLQNEELRASRADLESALMRHRYRQEHLPVACLGVDSATVVCDANLATGHLLGVPSDQLLGQSLTSFLTETSGRALRHLLDQARVKDESDPCAVHWLTPSGLKKPWLATINRDVIPGRFLLVLMLAPVPASTTSLS